MQNQFKEYNCPDHPPPPPTGPKNPISDEDTGIESNG